MADLVIGCDERDMVLCKQLIGVLPEERLLIGLVCQKEDGTVLCELPKNLLRVERIPLYQQALKIQLAKQCLEDGALVVVGGGAASLSDDHAQGRGVQRYLGDERGTATTGGLNRASQGLAITDQLIKIGCPPRI